MKQPFLIITFSFAAGIWLNQQFLLNISWLCYVGVVVAGALFLFTKRLSLIFLLIIFTALGSLWTQAWTLDTQKDISRLPYRFRSSALQIKGIVASDVERRKFFKTKKTVFTLKIKEIKTPFGWQKREGLVLANVFRDVNIFYGDEIITHGKLHPPFVEKGDDTFSYRDYLKIRNIDFLLSVKKGGLLEIQNNNQGHRLRQFSLILRNRIKHIFDNHLTANESGIMKAIILGDRSQVPKHVKELFLRTGTAHVLAISGLHIGAVAMIFLIMLRFLPLPSRYVYVLTCILLISYVLLTGMRPSVMRACIMIVTVLLGHVFEKQGNSLNNLALAAFLILLINPLNLFDVGFQLSFLCVSAILLIVPLLKKAFREKRGRIFHSFLVSLSVWLGVAGLIAYYFRVITPVSVMANLFVVPLITVVVFLGFALIGTSVIFPSISLWAATSLKGALNALVAIIFLFDQLPFTHFFVKDVTCWHLIIYYTIAITAFILLSRIDKDPQL